MILDDWLQKAQNNGLRIYDFASMGADGSQYRRMSLANGCNNSYSVAKAFTVTAIGMLWDQGRIDVGDRVYELLADEFPREFDPRFREVTVEHLLTHRAGFGRGFLDIDAENIGDYPSHDFLQIVLSEPLPYEPGSHYQYTDAAFYLLSRIVTHITGEKLDDFLRPVLYETMGFQEMAWSCCPLGYTMGATGLYISTKDMVKLGWVYVNGGEYEGKRVVSEAWVEQVLSRGYEFTRRDENGTYAKGGMFGQMLCFSLPRREAYAWHAYETRRDVGVLLKDLADRSGNA